MNPNRNTIDNPTGDPQRDRLRSVPDDHVLQSLNERNLQRARDFAKRMGEKWVLHRSHQPTRRDAFTLQGQN